GTGAVQHAGGYLSVYKHNGRLLKRVGDRVRNRETVAQSGDSGEVTSGPHLHFEIWHDGLAQDPAPYLLLPSRGAA
ncbi:MAG: M23 family metallopeptidase, partial [Bacteroidota bacterium]